MPERNHKAVFTCAHKLSAILTHLSRTEIEINALITFSSIEVFRCVRTRHPPSASFIHQIIPTQIIILIEISHQITELVCKNPHLYNLCLSQYNGAKITTNAWVSDAFFNSDALELDIDVSCQCYTYLLLCFIVLNL